MICRTFLQFSTNVARTIVLRREKKRLRTYRGVVNDDIIAGHIAMENVFFQVLDERALESQRHKREGKLNDVLETPFVVKRTGRNSNTSQLLF